MYTLVLMRHGESLWNVANRFTGWVDVDLTEKGILEAQQAGRLLKESGFSFDMAYTSVLKRAIRTLWNTLDTMDLMWIPIAHDWRLNERHYGALQGMNKAEVAARYGDEQVFIWRRSYDVAPDPLAQAAIASSLHDPRYKMLDKKDFPLTESLKDTVHRVLPFWSQVIAPSILSGQRVLISAHGNSLRALVKMLDNMNEKEIVGLNIPNGIPLVYELDHTLKPIRRYYLGESK